LLLAVLFLLIDLHIDRLIILIGLIVDIVNCADGIMVVVG